MEKVIAQPTPEILSVCAGVDAQIETLLEALIASQPTGRYEAHTEARCLFNLAIRQIEGVLTMARKDLALLPPAIAAARGGFEAAVKAAWLVDMDDLMDCEARWLVHVESEEGYLNRSAARLSKSGVSSESLLKRANQLRSFREAVDRALPTKVARIGRTPKFEHMLESIGGASLYVHYIETSQYMHAEHAATWLYRRGGVGTAKELGEFVEPKHWWLPLRIAWLTFTRPAQLFLARVGASPNVVAKLTRDQRIENLFSTLEAQGSQALH